MLFRSLVTAIIKAVSLLPLLVLCFWMGREDMDDDCDDRGESNLRQPLLGEAAARGLEEDDFARSAEAAQDGAAGPAHEQAASRRDPALGTDGGSSAPAERPAAMPTLLSPADSQAGGRAPATPVTAAPEDSPADSLDRKSTRLNSSHLLISRMPSSA